MFLATHYVFCHFHLFVFSPQNICSLMLSNYLCPILYPPPEFTSLSKHRKMFFLFLSVSSQCVIPKQLHHEILKGDNVNTCNTCISMYSKCILRKNVPFTTQISPSHLLLSLGLRPLAATYSFISGYPSPLHPSNTHFQTCYHEFFPDHFPQKENLLFEVLSEFFKYVFSL